MKSTYNIVLETDDSTVVTEYKKIKRAETKYQSEADLEKELIDMLKEQGYQYLYIKNETDLIENLRERIEILNNYKFTDDEWDIFFNQYIVNKNEGIIEKSKTIQEDYVKSFKIDNKTTQNIKLIDKKNIHNNFLQVINQYEENNGIHKNRYDVTILVNGLPLVHIELKRRGIKLKEAFNQINRYQRESFASKSGLFEYVQIFVISNGTNTKYYSNTTRDRVIKENMSSTNSRSYDSDKIYDENRSIKKTSNSFEFTSYWADSKNTTLPDLVDFTKTFFAKHTILNILTKYCVWTVDNMLLVMRPYQIVATEKIINKIIVSTNYKKTGTIDAGGYIWHTTGSGKTLTSFKTAKLATSLPFIDKVLFVVDRRDLDYQTMREYDKFEKGAANGNRSTEILKRQLCEAKEKSSIIITTIQKLSEFVKRVDVGDVFDKHIVMIFDECHRSQFGQMHTMITKKFKNYHLFGFTGTPIFAENSSSGGRPDLKTTEQAFGQRLHTYTIVDAIRDNNVLPFRIDYIDTIKQKDNNKDKLVNDIEREKALMNSQRISKISDYILEHFNQKTKRDSKSYEFRKVLNIQEIVKDKEIDPSKRVKEIRTEKGSRIKGFNSILCTQSIDMAKCYYEIINKKLEKTNQNLKIAIIYSFSANGDDNSNGNLDEEGFDTNSLSMSDREFLDKAILDYNKMFNTNYDSSGEGFENYYKDISHRMKNKYLDLLIVVNMFLTGFDATTLNTLWVDKNLKQHGLIQAFSRTNRILNSVKTYGNIVCFRDLSQNVDDAIAMFGDSNAKSVVLLKSYKEYYNEYLKLINELYDKFPVGEIISSEKLKKEFILLFGKILRLKNILSAFDEFTNDTTLNDRDLQDYTSMYNDIYENLKTKEENDKESILDDVVFELELVKQIEVNIDYILMLVEKYHESNCKNKEILVDIDKSIKSSPGLRSKRELIENFIKSINIDTKVAEDFKKYVIEKKENDLNEIIEKYNLNKEMTIDFIDNSLKYGELIFVGQDFPKLLPAISFFDNNRAMIKDSIENELKEYFEKYNGIINN